MSNVLVLVNAVRSAMADAIDDVVNTGSGTAFLRFRTGASAEVATVNLQNPAFGAAVNGVITLAGTPLQDTDAEGGTMANFIVHNRNNDLTFSGTVGTSGEAINFAGGLVVDPGDIVELTSFTVTVPSGS